jgi:uncharacterized damage-inducible protein DinB
MPTDYPAFAESLIETWRINHRVTLKLLEGLDDAALKATLSERGGRDIGRQLAHVHEVRTAWFRKEDAPKGITKFAKGDSPSKAALQKALNESGQAMEHLIRRCCEDGGTVSGFKRDVAALLGYLVAHESHHRGSILLTAKQTGHRLGEDLRWGLWAWDRI